MTAPITNHAAPVNAVTTAATISITNPAMTKGRLYLLSVTADRGSNAALSDPTAAQTGATWTAIRSQAYSNSGREKTTVFRCQPTADVASGTVTVTWAETSTRRIAVIDRTGDTILDDSANNGAACIVQNESTPYNTLVAGYSETLTNAIGAGNICYGISGARWGAAGAMLPGTGYVEISDHGTNSGTTLNITHQTECWNPNNGAQDGVIDNTRDSAGTNNGCMIGLELDFAVVPGDVFAVANPTLADVDAAGAAHYGGDASTLLDRMDPGHPRTNDAFCQAWWGKNFADCYREILLTERFVQLVRQGSQNQNPRIDNQTVYLTYLGGDMIDTFLDGGRRFWIGGDSLFANTPRAVDLTTNLFEDVTLFITRNHLTAEFTDGEIDAFGVTRDADALGAGFWYRAGANNSTWVTPNQTDHPSTLYWTVCGVGSSDSGVLCRVGAVLVLFPDPNPANALDHKVLDTHLLQIESSFGTISATAKFELPEALDFSIADIIEDTTYTYILFREADPGYPNVLTDLRTDTTYTHLARIDTSGTETIMDVDHTGTVYDFYEWWDGTAWSSDCNDSARLADVNSADIAGDAAIAKLGTDDWIMAAQRFFENERRVYKATSPQGPWVLIAEVSTPYYGVEVVTDMTRTCIHTMIQPDFPASAGHIMSMSATMTFESEPLDPNPDYPTLGRHIAADGLPYFIEIPTSGDPLVFTGNASVVNVVGITGGLGLPGVLNGNPSVVDVVGIGGDLIVEEPSGETLVGNPSVVNVVGVGGDLDVTNVLSGSASVVDVIGAGGDLLLALILNGNPSVVTVAGAGGDLEIGNVLAGSASIVGIVGIGGDLIVENPGLNFNGNPSVVDVVGIGGGLNIGNELVGSPSVVDVVAIGGDLEIGNVLAGGASVVDIVGIGGDLDVSSGLVGSPSVVDVVGISGILGYPQTLTGSASSVVVRGAGGVLTSTSEMARLYLPVNIEALVRRFLSGETEMINLVDERVYTVIPKPKRDHDYYPCVLVNLIADDPHDGPLWGIGNDIQISAYGGTKAQAWTIAATARALIDQRIAGIHELMGIVSGVTHGPMIDLPDETFDPAKPRWIFTSTIHAHPVATLAAS